MIPTVYIQSSSKAALNVLLKAGADLQVCVTEFLCERWAPLSEFPNGTVVKIWNRRDPHGTPIAKAYGNVQRRNGQLVIV